MVGNLERENRKLRRRVESLEQKVLHILQDAIPSIQGAVPPSNSFLEVDSFKLPAFGLDSGAQASAQRRGEGIEDKLLGPFGASWIPVDGTLACYMWYIPEDVPELFERWVDMGRDSRYVVTVDETAYIRACIRDDEIETRDGDGDENEDEDENENGDGSAQSEAATSTERTQFNPPTKLLRMSKPVIFAYQLVDFEDGNGATMIRQMLRTAPGEAVPGVQQ